MESTTHGLTTSRPSFWPGFRTRAALALSRLLETLSRSSSPGGRTVFRTGPGTRAGTGVFTHKLIEKGFQQQDLTLIEYGSEFVGVLQLCYPGARVLWMDAARLDSEAIGDSGSYGSVVSGLPLLTMPPRKVLAILSGAFRFLRPHGAFYQFTYGPRVPISMRILDRLGLRAKFVGRTMNNIPPAAVYRITRRPPCRLVVSNDSRAVRSMLPKASWLKVLECLKSSRSA